MTRRTARLRAAPTMELTTVADNQIPPPFRGAFGPILDEPAPPTPPEVEDDDDGDGGHHTHFLHPVVMLLSNGSVQTMSWTGSAVVGWFCVASFVTLWTVADVVWRWLTGIPVMLIAIEASAALAWFAIGCALAGILRRWRAGRKARP